MLGGVLGNKKEGSRSDENLEMELTRSRSGGRRGRQSVQMEWNQEAKISKIGSKRRFEGKTRSRGASPEGKQRGVCMRGYREVKEAEIRFEI